MDFTEHVLIPLAQNNNQRYCNYIYDLHCYENNVKDVKSMKRYQKARQEPEHPGFDTEPSRTVFDPKMDNLWHVSKAIHSDAYKTENFKS
jgi:hypothetical protein